MVAFVDGLRLVITNQRLAFPSCEDLAGYEAMAFLPVLAALAVRVIAALLTAVVFGVVAFSVYLVIVHRRYAHIPQPKGAS